MNSSGSNHSNHSMHEAPGRRRKQVRLFMVLLIISIAIRFTSLSKQTVEDLYSNGLYPPIARFMRAITGWAPFSLGDIFYILVIVWFVYKLMKYRNQLVAYNSYLPGFKRNALKWINRLLMVYIVFNLMWGLNYNRKGIHHQMGFSNEKYTQEELVTINELLLENVNKHRQLVGDSNCVYPSPRDIFTKAAKAYQQAAVGYPFLQYQPASIKKSYFGWLGNYLGFSGYYNPFSGEAQVNSSIPPFLQPFVSCHEIAHQLGYARENEANFVGYWVATASGDPVFEYSAYLDIFLYANRNLYRADSLTALNIRNQLSPQVKTDLEILRKFYLRFQNPVEPYVRWAYGKYLQANDQPSGMLSYHEVIADLVGYYKKYGRIAMRREE